MSPEAELFKAKSRVGARSSAFPVVLLLTLFIPTILVLEAHHMRSNGELIPFWQAELIQCVAGLVLAAALVAVVLVLLPTRVAVDAEGIELRWLWQRRFVPHASVRAIETYKDTHNFNPGVPRDRGLVIRHDDGEETLALADDERRRLFITLFARRNAVGRARVAEDTKAPAVDDEGFVEADKARADR